MFRKFALIALLSSSSVFAAPPTKSVTLLWDYPVVPADLAGFHIYWASSPGGYAKTAAGLLDPTKAVGTVLKQSPLVTTFVDVRAPLEGPSYYVATAFDSSGNESLPSNEVVSIDTFAPVTPGNLHIGGVIVNP